VRLDGIIIYPGNANVPKENQKEVITGIDHLLNKTLNLWKQYGLEARIVSGGSPPTAFLSDIVSALTEIRSVTYIYNDMNCVTGGWSSLDDCAARVVSTVVSNAVLDRCVLDAGSKTLSSD